MGAEVENEQFLVCDMQHSQQLTLAVVELAIATFMLVNVFFHLCARNWRLGTLLFNVLCVALELTATILAILFYTSSSAVADFPVSPYTIVIYIAGGLSLVRMVFALVACCVRKADIKEEKGSSWELFWPVIELLVSAGSALALVTLAYVIRSCLEYDEK